MKYKSSSVALWQQRELGFTSQYTMHREDWLYVLALLLAAIWAVGLGLLVGLIIVLLR